MDKKVKLVNFVKGTELDALFEQAKREMPQYLERAKLIAKVRKANYDASITAGFTPEQALFLCKE